MPGFKGAGYARGVLIRSPTCVLTALLIAALAPTGAGQTGSGFRVGAARLDVTPETPIRLSGYGGRRNESEGVVQRLYARALAVDDGVSGPAVLISVDNVAVPGWLVEQTAARLTREIGLARDRLVIVSTHTHTGPMLRDAIPNMFGTDVPAEHQARIDLYTALLGARMVEAARAAVANLQPGRLATGRGSIPVAANRRTAGGPVDHELPFLAATAADGALVALVANYACHCTTLGGNDNFVCGDWAGYAAESLELDQSGAVALITIGCGADSNPASYGLEQAKAHGRTLADEVGRLLGGALQPLPGRLTTRIQTIRLPFDRLPTRDEWQVRLAQGGAVAYHAQKNLDRLDRGESLPQELAYPIATWTFGDDLALVFLAGEVVVDYSLRLNREFDAARLWITAYANDVPCYIPSERILREGGYEAEGAMIYYDRPTRLQAGVEQRIVDAVREQLPEAFRTVLGVDVSRTEGVAPKPPAAARAALRVHDGLRVELVASEPLVESPVAIDFGLDGSLWVCEMPDYPSGMDGLGKPGGRIVVLRDQDGDGQLDRRTIFLDDLPFPTGVTVWGEGALVCASNDILYAADHDGDGRADEVRPLYSGFRTDNFQARVNSLELGLDGWYWGASGLPTGAITSFAGGALLELGGRDFRIRPETGAIEAAAGLTQQGRCRDDFGQAFGCDNSTLLRHYPLAEHYLRRNPHLTPPSSSVLVPREPDSHRLFPISRILTRFNDPESAGRVTSGCGIGLYRDDLLGPDFSGNSFTCEPVHNLVTRLVLRPEGATFAGSRAAVEASSEFLASTDPWFRPVQARTGPDGALYVVDMARFVIEHPTWIPEDRLAHLDVRAGAQLGRIWRVVPTDRPLRRVPRLDQLSGAALVAALDTPNGTVRDQVQSRLTAPAAVPPFAELRHLARNTRHPAVLVQALSVLAQSHALRAEDLHPALSNPHTEVRRNAVRLSEELLDADPTIFDAVLALRADPELPVRLQVACSLGESRRQEAGMAIMAGILDDELDEYMRAAWFSSMLPHLELILQSALLLDEYGSEGSSQLPVLVGIAVQSQNVPAQTAIVEHIARAAEQQRWSKAIAWGAALLEAADREGTPFTMQARLAPVLDRARQIAGDAAAEPQLRAQALLLLGRDPQQFSADLDALAALLGGTADLDLQTAALVAIARMPDARAGAVLLTSWDRASPALRPPLLDALLAREIFVGVLLDALAARPDLLAALDPARRLILLEHPVPTLRARAAQLFASAVDPDRAELVARYALPREPGGNLARGTAIFAASCALCHRLDGAGTAIGPDLASVTDRSAQALLVSILDPNRAINPEYVNYLVSTRDGRFLSGLIRDESAGSLRLLTLAGQELELMRSNVKSIADTRASLMPTGFETLLTPADMAELIAYLQSVGSQPKSFSGNRPEIVTPLEDGGILLTAAQSAIHGDSLVFEAAFQNLGFWSSANDRAVWEVRTAAAGEWDLTLEYACDDGVAGNRLVIDGDGSSLTSSIAGTGGWSRYRTVSLGRITLPAGISRVTARSEGEIRGALLDLRALRLLPPGAAPTAPAATSHPLDAVLEGMQAGTPEEYERIPALWQFAIAAGRANEDAELRALLDRALPQADEPLLHWQAVVIGGGVVNGLTQAGTWPRERLRDLVGSDPQLSNRLARAIDLAAALAHDAAVPAGTRYDALRLLGISSWEAHGADLTRYLKAGTDPELQMGAVSGLGNLADPRAWDALRAALNGLTPENRVLADEALRRVPSLDQCLDAGLDLWGEMALRQTEGPTYEFFADLLPPPRYVNTDFRHYPIVLSAPNSAVKARFVSNGSGVHLNAGTSTWHDGDRVPFSFFVIQGDAREPYGGDLSRLDGPRLTEGWLPIVNLSYEHQGVRYRQEAFASGDPEDAVLCVRFTSSAPGIVVAQVGGKEPIRWHNQSLQQKDGRVLARTHGAVDFSEEQRALIASVDPNHPADFFLYTRGTHETSLMQYPMERKHCVDAWSETISRSAQVSTGEKIVDDAWRALIVGSLTLAQGDVLNYSAGNLYETTFEAECGDAARALMAWGVPGAERFVPPLLARPLQGGVFLNDVAFKLQLLAWTHFFQRDAAWTRAQLPLVLSEAEGALEWIEAETGLIPAQAYCGDILTPCHNLYANAAFWRGLRDLALVLRDLGGADHAQAKHFEDAATALRDRVLEAVAASERVDVDPPFIPVALFGVESPYTLLTETMQGAYWNLVAPFVYDSGIFGPNSPRTAAMVDWQLRRGGLCMGMSRFHQHSGLFANEDGLDDLYTLRLVEELLKRDDADRALVSFYGKLAQGMTRDTFIGCEGSGLRPLDTMGRAMYLPPNVSANAFFLFTLRHLLVQDFDLDCDGRADELRLLYATPRAWLADGGRIAVDKMPTFFGPVSLEANSELSRGRVRVRLELPSGLTVPARLKLRLPAGYERADGAGEIIDLAPGGGKREFEVKIRPSSK